MACHGRKTPGRGLDPNRRERVERQKERRDWEGRERIYKTGEMKMNRDDKRGKMYVDLMERRESLIVCGVKGEKTKSVCEEIWGKTRERRERVEELADKWREEEDG
jgi:hypothetical protein